MESPPTNINLHTNAKLIVLLSNTCTVGMKAEEVTNSFGFIGRVSVAVIIIIK